jgi:hypothetical protein
VNHQLNLSNTALEVHMKTRYEILPRSVRFAASFAAVLCTSTVLAGIAGLAEPESTQFAQSAVTVVAQAGAGSTLVR